MGVIGSIMLFVRATRGHGGRHSVKRADTYNDKNIINCIHYILIYLDLY